MLGHLDEGLVSSVYTVFEIVDHNILDPEYLMMWFRRPEFDRYARYMSHGSVREIFGWEEMCGVELPVPDIERQREIVREYNVVVNRIKLNERMNQKLEETAQAIYRHMFVSVSVEDEFERLGLYIEFDPRHSIKKQIATNYVEMADLQEANMTIRGYIRRPFVGGSKFKNGDTLLARITPCLENGKTAYISTFKENEVAFGSTEFIVMRAKKEVSPYWVYCLARDENFREYAISSMVGSSGRQRVHSDYLKEYAIRKIETSEMEKFHENMHPIFSRIKNNALENQNLQWLSSTLLAEVSAKKRQGVAA
jgi:type I restriction enzyme S subunit